MKLRDAGRAATCEQLTGRREPCCQLCLRRAALGGPGSRGAGGGRAASAAPGPRGPAGSGAILPGGTTPAPGRQGRAGPRLPARAPPGLSSRRSPAPSTNQRRKAGADSVPPRLAPGDRRPPRGAPCGRPGCCAQAPQQCGRLSRRTEISLKQSVPG